MTDDYDGQYMRLEEDSWLGQCNLIGHRFKQLLLEYPDFALLFESLGIGGHGAMKRRNYFVATAVVGIAANTSSRTASEAAK